jgi:hypothetical protein
MQKLQLSFVNRVHSMRIDVHLGEFAALNNSLLTYDQLLALLCLI